MQTWCGCPLLSCWCPLSALELGPGDSWHRVISLLLPPTCDCLQPFCSCDLDLLHSGHLSLEGQWPHSGMRRRPWYYTAPLPPTAIIGFPSLIFPTLKLNSVITLHKPAVMCAPRHFCGSKDDTNRYHRSTRVRIYLKARGSALGPPRLARGGRPSLAWFIVALSLNPAFNNIFLWTFLWMMYFS